MLCDPGLASNKIPLLLVLSFFFSRLHVFLPCHYLSIFEWNLHWQTTTDKGEMLTMASFAHPPPLDLVVTCGHWFCMM